MQQNQDITQISQQNNNNTNKNNNNTDYSKLNKEELIQKLRLHDLKQEQQNQKEEKLNQKMKKKHTVYPQDVKERAIDLANSTNENNITIANMLNKEFHERNYNITESNIRDWIKLKTIRGKQVGLTQMQLVNRKKRKTKVKSKPRYPQVELLVQQKFNELLNQKVVINFKWFQAQYTHFLSQDKGYQQKLNSKIIQFKNENNCEIISKKDQERLEKEVCTVSRGLIQRMLKRLNISYRVSTHKTSKFKEDLVEKVSQFITDIKTYIFQVEQLRHLGENITNTVIINSDQTAIVFDYNQKTYAYKGTKQVSVLKHNKEKERYTVWLAVSNKGQKLKPFIIAKGQSEVTNYYPNDISVHTNKKGWATQDMVVSFIKYRIFNFPLAQNETLIKIFDSYACHKSEKTKNFIKENQPKKSNPVKFFLIPPGFTPFLQPLDVSINKCFKNNIQKYLIQWWQEKGCLENNLTPSGYFKAPSHKIRQKIIIDSWNEVPESLIIKSFQICGIHNHSQNLHQAINKEEIKKTINDKWEIFVENLKNQTKEDDEGYQLKEQMDQSLTNEYVQDDVDNSKSISSSTSSQSSDSQFSDQEQAQQVIPQDAESQIDQKKETQQIIPQDIKKSKINLKKDNMDIKIEEEIQPIKKIKINNTQQLEKQFAQKWLQSDSEGNSDSQNFKSKIKSQQKLQQKSVATFFKLIPKEEKKAQMEQKHQNYQQQKEEIKFLKEYNQNKTGKLKKKKKFLIDDEDSEELPGSVKYQEDTTSNDSFSGNSGEMRLQHRLNQMQQEKNEENSDSQMD